METIAIEFLTQSTVILTEGLLQMLDQQVSSNTLINKYKNMSRTAEYILLLKQQPQTLEVKKEIQNLQQQLDKN